MTHLRTLACAVVLAVLPLQALAAVPGLFIPVPAPALTTKQITDPGGNSITVPDQLAPGVFYIVPTVAMVPSLTPYVAPSATTPSGAFAGEPTTALMFADQATANTVLNAYKPCSFIPNARILGRLRALGKDALMGAALQKPAYAAIFSRMLLGGGLCADDPDAATALTAAGLTPAQVLVP